PAGRRVGLPTYAFQHESYWPPPARPGGAGRLGLAEVGHPLLGAGVELGGGQGYLLTGQLSVRSQPWLADHVVAGVIVVPGTAFAEMAVTAGLAAGCSRIGELTLEQPLILPAGGAVNVQAAAGPADSSGARQLTVYARPAAAGPGTAWARHASGYLTPPDPAGTGGLAGEFAAWPPPGARPADISGLYAALAAAGCRYGPAFRGVRRAWHHHDGGIYADITLPAHATPAASGSGYHIHPALLDAALHPATLMREPAGVEQSGAEVAPDESSGAGVVQLPFSYTGVSLHATGATALRVRLRPEGNGLSLAAADEAGVLVLSADSLVSRPISAATFAAASDGPQQALLTVEWTPIPADGAAPGRWALIGASDPALGIDGPDIRDYPGLAALAAAVQAGQPVPEVVLACLGSPADAGSAAEAARRTATQVLGLVQEWLGHEQLAAAQLVLVTRGAVAAVPGEGVTDLAAAAAWGLVRSAQSENPGRLILADLPAGPVPGHVNLLGTLAGALATGEPELAIREQGAYGRRLARPAGELTPPDGPVPWRLDITEQGSLDALRFVACPEVAAPLGPGQVRVAVRAAGMNFRDIAISLGLIQLQDSPIGGDLAGVVTETGPGVTGLAAGDRVLGMVGGAFGPVAVTDARLLVRIPDGWSFAQAASVPSPFMTAWYGLVDLAGARAGQRVLVHAAAGGVGMAAVSIGRYLGLEVYGTASAGKHGVLAGRGLDAAHVASSRDGGFAAEFLAATGGAGVDIVLNALAGELTDASLRLLPRGG
ncbi:MAG TPA: polyketide synthase dehydratase domain-containing protein, partial [Streptosporangiaceae bacterium]